MRILRPRIRAVWKLSILYSSSSRPATAAFAKRSRYSEALELIAISPQKMLPNPVRVGSLGMTTMVAMIRADPSELAEMRYMTFAHQYDGKVINRNDAAVTLPAIMIEAFVSVT